MGILKTLSHWAASAWGLIAGLSSAENNVLLTLWHYITGEHNMLSWIAGNPILKFLRTVLLNLTALGLALDVIRDVLHRMAGWIWVHEVRPVRDRLQAELTRLANWTAAEFITAFATMQRLYVQALAYTRQQVGIERAQRVQAVKAEHAAMLAGDKATLATVQREAVTAYDAGVHARIGVAGNLLNDLVTRTPLIKDLVDYVINGALDLVDIENPVLGWLVTKAVDEIVAKVGIDQLAAQAAQSLLAPVIGQPRPKGLHDVVGDLDGRIQALERQWAEFMKDGGPEVEQAGKEWKDITGLTVDAGILGMVGLAMADPAAWAAAIADTVGVAGDAALTAVVDLIGRA